MTRRKLVHLLSAGLAGQSVSGPVRFGGGVKITTGYTPTVHVLYGQSLSAGGLGTPAITTTQPYTNRMFVGGSVLGDGYTELPPTTSIASLSSLTEGVSVNQESPSSAFANQISYMARQNGRGEKNDSMVSSWGKSGAAYIDLKKGTARYSYLMDGITKAAQLIPGMIVPAVQWIHGEADGSCGYAQKLTANTYPLTDYFQLDLQNDIQAITGQSQAVPVFMSQPIANPCATAGNPRPPWFYDDMLALYEQLGVNQATPKFILVCPKYMLPQNADRIHLTNYGYQWLGEYHAKAYYQQVVQGIRWDCLRPTGSTVSGNVISITFNVPYPPLVFDTTQVSLKTNYGFVHSDASTITAVNITNDGTGTGIGVVELTLTAPPVNTSNITVSYGGAGSSTSAGNLRDSDPTVSRSGNNLYNWCVNFAKKSTWTCCPGTA